MAMQYLPLPQGMTSLVTQGFGHQELPVTCAQNTLPWISFYNIGHFSVVARFCWLLLLPQGSISTLCLSSSPQTISDYGSSFLNVNGSPIYYTTLLLIPIRDPDIHMFTQHLYLGLSQISQTKHVQKQTSDFLSQISLSSSFAHLTFSKPSGVPEGLSQLRV